MAKMSEFEIDEPSRLGVKDLRQYYSEPAKRGNEAVHRIPKHLIGGAEAVDENKSASD